MTLVILALAATAFTIWRIQRATPVARPAAVTPQATAGRSTNQHCSVHTCNEPVVVRIHAGHNYWPMCMGHGLPFLLEELVS